MCSQLGSSLPLALRLRRLRWSLLLIMGPALRGLPQMWWSTCRNGHVTTSDLLPRLLLLPQLLSSLSLGLSLLLRQSLELLLLPLQMQMR
jgi:hypothetical protein